MRYEVRSVMMTRPRKGSAPDFYHLALIQSEDRARPPMLLRFWRSGPYGEKSIVQIGHTSEKAAELRETFGGLLAGQTAKGYEVNELVDGQDFSLIDLFGEKGISKTAWWFQLAEPGQNQKVVSQFRMFEEIDPEPEHESIMQMLSELAQGRSPVNVAAAKPTLVTQYIPTTWTGTVDVYHDTVTSAPSKKIPSTPAPAKSDPAVEMPGWGEWS